MIKAFIEVLKFPFHLENGLKLAAATAKIEKLEKELHQCRTFAAELKKQFDKATSQSEQILADLRFKDSK